MTDVLLATCDDLPHGEELDGTTLLLDAFARRGLDARWVSWSEPGVDWSAAGAVAARATWDYTERLEEFLDWARGVGPGLLNGPEVFAWNTDKSYLLALAHAGLPVVPTLLVEGEEDLPAAIAELGTAVVKPTIGAGGRGVSVFDLAEGGEPELDESGLVPPPWIVQPLVESVRTEGETSVFVLDGQVVSQARKRPGGGQEIRVHPRYGGSTVALDPTAEATGLALHAVDVAQQLLGRRLDYARVDAMRLEDDRLVLSELEVTEPGLYLEIIPGNADAFAALVQARLEAR